MKCSLCEQLFPTWEFYRQHLNNAHDAPMTVCCRECGFESESSDDIKTHYHRHHYEKSKEAKKLIYDVSSKPYMFRWRNERSRIEKRGARVFQQRRARQQDDGRRGTRQRGTWRSRGYVPERMRTIARKWGSEKRSREERKVTDRTGESEKRDRKGKEMTDRREKTTGREEKNKTTDGEGKKMTDKGVEEKKEDRAEKVEQKEESAVEEVEDEWQAIISENEGDAISIATEMEESNNEGDTEVVEINDDDKEQEEGVENNQGNDKDKEEDDKENDMMKENEEQEDDPEDGDRRVVELTPKRKYWEVKLGEESDEEDRIVIKLRRPLSFIHK